eukprot:TRINITY_DN11288_c0_g1_i5.p1 TRINITY_DN11288_c0_g1~~TRINITY_DN11288_c0_g1_i5.p1  ORF type:complete len:229 (+),score=38.11 TRINITY_DN11288_c0_g1_i5:147-833(+)
MTAALHRLSSRLDFAIRQARRELHPDQHFLVGPLEAQLQSIVEVLYSGTDSDANKLAKLRHAGTTPVLQQHDLPCCTRHFSCHGGAVQEAAGPTGFDQAAHTDPLVHKVMASACLTHFADCVLRSDNCKCLQRTADNFKKVFGTKEEPAELQEPPEALEPALRELEHIQSSQEARSKMSEEKAFKAKRLCCFCCRSEKYPVEHEEKSVEETRGLIKSGRNWLRTTGAI